MKRRGPTKWWNFSRALTASSKNRWLSATLLQRAGRLPVRAGKALFRQSAVTPAERPLALAPGEFFGSLHSCLWSNTRSDLADGMQNGYRWHPSTLSALHERNSEYSRGGGTIRISQNMASELRLVILKGPSFRPQELLTETVSRVACRDRWGG